MKLWIEVLENILLFRFYILNLGGNPWSDLFSFSLQYIQTYIKITVNSPVSKDTLGLYVRVDPGWYIAMLIIGRWDTGPLFESDVSAIWYYRSGDQFEKHVFKPKC